MYYIGVVFFLLIVALASVPALRAVAVPKRKWCLVGLLGIFLGAVVLGPQREDDPSLASQRKSLPAAQPRAGFVISQACRKCHPGSYSTWHKTYHRTMTQVVSPETVLASFNNATCISKEIFSVSIGKAASSG